MQIGCTINTLGIPGSSLSVSVATWNCSILMSSSMMWEAAPLVSFLVSCSLALTMSANL